MKYKNFNEINFLINNYFIIYWKKIIFLIVLSFIGATCISLSPMVLAPALDIGFSTTIEPASNLNNINLNNIGASIVHYFKFLPDNDQIFLVIILVLIFLIIGGFGVLVEFFSHLLSTSITLNVYNKLQFNLYNHILNLNLKFFIKNKSSELTSRFVNDASEAIMSLDSALRQGLQSCIQILIYGFLLIKTSVELAVYVLLISSLHYIINKFLKSRVLDTTSEKFNKIANIGSFLNESFSNFRIIKIFSSQNFQKEKFKKILQQFKNITWKFWLYKHVETPLRKITDMTALGFILILAFSSLQSNELTATGFLLFMVVVRQTIAPISILSQSLIRCYETLGSTRRILDVLNNVTDNKFGKKKLSFFNKKIEFKNVTFGYSNDKYTLKNIDFSIKKGEIVALVGPSGAGKSTLVDLLLGLFNPQKGSILIDGESIYNYDEKNYRNLFGVVPQDSLLSHLTIKENIAYSKEKTSMRRLGKASEIAYANEFIEKLPLKYNTLIGERGVKLSGGQKQRIAIARALYNSPKILILDEATSSLDSLSEKYVQNAMKKILKNNTAFIIAHRLSSIKLCDKIIVLNKGTIEAIGTHEKLLGQSKTYKKLSMIQNI